MADTRDTSDARLRATGEDRGPLGVPVVAWLLGGAALVTILFYREFIFHPGRLLFGSDMLLEGFPLRRFFVDQLRDGHDIPLWTPYVYGGMPYVALLPGPLFYPTTLLYFLLPLYRAIGWTFVLHTFLAGAFGYFLGRSFRLRPWAAAVCGTSFMLTGYVTSHLYGGQDGRMFAMTLIPLALGMLERGLRSGEIRWFAGLGLAVGLQILTPHAQIVYFSSLALVLYVLHHLAFRVRSGEGEGVDRYLLPTAKVAAAFVAAAALGAIQLLPTFALLDHVTRQATESGYAFAASFALPWQELTAPFLPDLIGSLGTYWGSNPLKLHTEYMGAVPVSLALLAFAASLGSVLRSEERRAVWFLSGGSLLGVLFALGAKTPVHRIAYALLPMIGSFRAPAMMMAPVVVFVSLLAGFGWEAVLAARAGGRDPGPKDRGSPAGVQGGGGLLPASPVWLAVLGAPFLLLGLAAALAPSGLLEWVRLAWYPRGWPRQPSAELEAALRTGGLLLLAGFGVAWGLGLAVARRRVPPVAVLLVLLVTAVDLWRVDARYLEVAPADAVLGEDEIIRTLEAEAAPGERIWAFQDEPPMYRENQFMYWGLSSATGNQKFILDPYFRLVGTIRPDDGLRRHAAALIPLLDVTYLVTRTEQSEEVFERRAEADGRILYRVRGGFPHAWFPARVETVADTSEARTRVWSNPAPLDVAFVETDPATVLGPSAAGPPGAGAGSARLTAYRADEVELEVEAETGGLLVVSEIHQSGWHAFVDDVEVPMWRTDVALRGVGVPSGTHRVRFCYRSAAFVTGAWLSAIAATGLLLVLALGGRLTPAGAGVSDGGASST